MTGLDVSGEGVVVAGEGVEVTTGARSIDVTSTLNADSVTLTVYEDTTGDGTIDRNESFTLSGGSETFTPNTLQYSSGDVVIHEITAEDDGDVTTACSISNITYNY